MERLRPLSEKLLLVVNKVDTPDRDSLVWNAHSHGFPRVIGVSAVHGRNLPELKELIALLLEERQVDAWRAMGTRRGARTNADAVRIAILGKPNTGKSSLANRLLGENRSIVSAVPGTTRDVVEGSFEHGNRTFAVLDTAGIRRKSRVTDAVEYYSVNRAIESIERADLVFLMIDASEGLVDQDKKIAGQALRRAGGSSLCRQVGPPRHRRGNRPAARKRGAARGRGPNGKPRACSESRRAGQRADSVPFSRARLCPHRPCLLRHRLWHPRASGHRSFRVGAATQAGHDGAAECGAGILDGSLSASWTRDIQDPVCDPGGLEPASGSWFS